MTRSPSIIKIQVTPSYRKDHSDSTYPPNLRWSATGTNNGFLARLEDKFLVVSVHLLRLQPTKARAEGTVGVLSTTTA
jgi:hypothetical protein